MCGIAGYIGSSPSGPDAVAACLRAMARRGPDATGFVERRLSDGTVIQLLHSRLSILDLDERSNQPLAAGPVTVCMNGEIYNYVELRQELVDLGWPFRTTGDAEVAAAALAAYGLDAFGRFEAMFATASLDEQAGTVVLARDRFGEKPLLFMKAEHGVYFGSEVRYLQLLSGRDSQVEVGTILRFLVNGYKDLYKHEETFLRGVERIPAGGGLIRGVEGQWETFRYHRPSEALPDETLTFAEAVEGTRERLSHAVDLRLRADVPVAICLSGGVDSNVLLGIARNVLGRDVEPFSIVGSDPRYDESSAIRASADWFGLTSNVKTMTGFNALEVLEDVTQERGAPVATANQFALWSLMREISQAGYRVAISGLGADELFTGYYDHHLYFLQDLDATDPHLASMRKQEWLTEVLPIVRNPSFRKPDRDLRSASVLEEMVFGETARRRDYLTAAGREYDLAWREAQWSQSLLRNRMANELWQETVPLTLHEEDHNAMYWSVENRSPYLDSRLLAWSQIVPLRYFIRGGRAKTILREAGRGIAPDFILDNSRKTGFNLSVTDLMPRDRQAVVDFVADSGLSRWLDLVKIAALLRQEHFSDADNKFAFSLISSAAFLRVFEGGAGASSSV